MCGIAGIYDLNKQNINRKVLHRMDEVLVHRGPDGHGEMIDKNIGLANRRLAIIDPSPLGSQPMASPDSNYWITFNGEIFNFQEIKNGLLNVGCTFNTNTDTEVVLNSFIKYKEDCLRNFIGHFAFAVFDKRKNSLFLARDHLGVNPLYYSVSDGIFLFASEVKAILASGLVKREIDRQTLYHYLSTFSIYQPATIFSSIKSLLPGSYMTVEKGNIKVKKYWHVPDSSSNIIDSFSDAQEKLEKLLVTSVKYATVADVPVAAFLSGGIDSSTVVALMAQNTGKKVKTYSLFDPQGADFDERKYSRIIARKFNTDHTEFTLNDKDILQGFSDFIYYLDQPNGEALETYFLSYVIAKDVKVALSGLGGDELFAGYHGIIYSTRLLSRLYRYLPEVTKNAFLSLIKIMPISSDFKKTLSLSSKFLNLSTPLEKRLFFYFVYSQAEKKNLFSPDFLNSSRNLNTADLLSSVYRSAKFSNDQINGIAYLDLNSYTRDNLLLPSNIAGMAHSLEIRMPLLDRRLVEFSFCLPEEFKIHNGISKYIFRQTVKKWLPEVILSHKKTGFGLPRIKYMKGVLKPLILDALSEKSVSQRGIFNHRFVKQVVTDFYHADSGKMLWTEHLRIWTLFIFEMWARRYLD